MRRWLWLSPHDGHRARGSLESGARVSGMMRVERRLRVEALGKPKLKILQSHQLTVLVLRLFVVAAAVAVGDVAVAVAEGKSVAPPAVDD